MHPELFDEPVSSRLPEFQELVCQRLQRGEAVILLVRYAYCGGAKDYFIVRSPDEFRSMLQRAGAKTSMTVFFEQHFPIRGHAGPQLCEQAVQMLPRVVDDGIYLIRIDVPGVDFGEETYQYASSVSEIEDWFRFNRDAPMLGGTLEFWHANCPEMISVYVPDADGVIRPGAY